MIWCIPYISNFPYPSAVGDDAILVDPMCGSGTILSEAALIARNAAPGLMRPAKQWPFRRWPDADKKGMLEAVQEARDLARPWNGTLLGNDMHAVRFGIKSINGLIFSWNIYVLVSRGLFRLLEEMLHLQGSMML